MIYRQTTLMLALLLTSFASELTLACSMAPGVPYPSPPSNFEKYSDAKSAFLVKVLEIRRTAPWVDDLNAEIIKENSETDLKITELNNEIQRVEDNGNFQLEIRKANSQLVKLGKILKSQYGKFGEIEEKPFGHKLYKFLAEVRKERIDSILSTKNKMLALENRLQIIKLQKRFNKQRVKKLKKNFRNLERVYIGEKYHGPIVAKLEIVKVYKGARSIGEKFTLEYESVEFPNSCGGGNFELNHYIYQEAKPNQFLVIYDKFKGRNTSKTSPFQLGLYGGKYDKKSIDERMLSYTTPRKNVKQATTIKPRTLELIELEAESIKILTPKDPLKNYQKMVTLSIREHDGKRFKIYRDITIMGPTKILSLRSNGKTSQLMDFTQKVLSE